MEAPEVKKSYQDHMGNHVIEYASGVRSIHSTEDGLLYGDYGHSFHQGFFVVNQQGEMVYAKDAEYPQIVEKCRPYWKVLRELQKAFPGYRIEPSRGERLSVNDKIIKGVLLYPGMRMSGTLEETVEFIKQEIHSRIFMGEKKSKKNSWKLLIFLIILKNIKVWVPELGEELYFMGLQVLERLYWQEH